MAQANVYGIGRDDSLVRGAKSDPLPSCPRSLPTASSWVKQQHHCRAQPPWESQQSHGESCHVARPSCR